MRIKQMRIVLSRSLRHAPYIMSEPTIELIGLIGLGENVPAAVEELEEDAQILIDRVCATERRKYKEWKEEKDAVQNGN